MFKGRWKPVAAAMFLLVSILLTGAGPLPPQETPPETKVSPRNQVYGDPEATLRLQARQTMPAQLSPLPQPQGIHSSAGPDALKHSAAVYSILSYFTGRSTLYKTFNLNADANLYQENIQFFDGGTDSYLPHLNPDGRRVVF